jgi:bifunctional non-homologous end joining protein LigD
MSLSKYHEKRNFAHSPEPKGKTKEDVPGSAFVVQRHKASRLHYDFRLEVHGVLKSWAVPKGPSMNPEDKRLAMMVEDHPYDYKDFEGTIPDGNYGAGIVEIWDKGTYTDLEEESKEKSENNMEKAIAEGNVKFHMYGRKLRGEFALVKIRQKDGVEDNSWLLIKHKDEYAVSESYSSEEWTEPDSPINQWLLENKKPAKKKTSNQRSTPGNLKAK